MLLEDTAPAVPRIGVWTVGARGSLATTVVAGAAALEAGLVAPTGCVTELPPFHAVGLPPAGDLVFGGHDVVDVGLPERARRLADSGVLPAALLPRLRGAMEAADLEVRTGVRDGCTEPQSAVAARLTADLADFRARHRLDQVVVVNLASTEPLPAHDPAHTSLTSLRAALNSRTDVLPSSSLYAYAALDAGCSYVNFTPSAGACLPALEELARLRGVPHTGRDGKTGETLVKSVLAPMFGQRALKVRAWAGSNLLGGGDGATLDDPEAARSKIESKRRSLREILGHEVEDVVHIDNVPALGEWKTAWNHIAFEGFLGVGMTLQFTWQGCDSALAAPLVLDLVRLTSLAARRGEAGALPSLGFFFKDPLASTEHSLSRQYDALCAWAAAAPRDASRHASLAAATVPGT
ncbi:inositol-3-phosphate synthase [Streptomyces sp. NPDC050549]|uniref:inositol-3-phosphate synthase n=1 Tax=Streptomyces sp. NPDC050549 TaxID=3155406 RepID=UPI003412CAAA